MESNYEIVSFEFDSVNQRIEVVKRWRSNNMYLTNPPTPLPDTVIKYVYGIKGGKLKLLQTIQGKHTPSHYVPETLTF